MDRGTQIIATERQGATPLHAAVAQGHGSTAALLLDRGAQVSATDSDGSTPLHWAAAAGKDGMVALLLNHGIIWHDLLARAVQVAAATKRWRVYYLHEGA